MVDKVPLFFLEQEQGEGVKLPPEAKPHTPGATVLAVSPSLLAPNEFGFMTHLNHIQI